MPKLTREEALRELARRRGLLGEPGTFRLEHYLFDKQLAFVKDPASFKIAVTTRRAGKSISCVADLTHTALETPECVVLYITLSRKNAKRLVWPEFKKLNKLFQLGGDINEADLTITYPNGSVAYILGASDRGSIEDFRGLALKKVYLDESQSFPAYIEQLVDDVLGPALMDHDGQLVLIGTPGPVPNGYFYDLAHNANWSHHHWSFFDNPKLPFLLKGKTHQDMLNRELERRGVKAADPSIQREWFGKWIVDTNSLVFRYTEGANDYGTLPSGKWTYILGVDYGYNDSDALAVLAYSDGHSEVYLVEERITAKQDIAALCAQIDELNAIYSFDRMVFDTGGLGKKITEEISKRYSCPMLPADKVRKQEKIELLNDALRTKKFLAKRSSRFAHDAAKVEWDHDKSTPDKRVISDRFHSDICDAVLYAFTECYHFLYTPKKADAVYGSQEWMREEEDRMFEATKTRLETAQEESEGGLYQPNTDYFDNDNIQKTPMAELRYKDRFKAFKG